MTNAIGLANEPPGHGWVPGIVTVDPRAISTSKKSQLMGSSNHENITNKQHYLNLIIP